MTKPASRPHQARCHGWLLVRVPNPLWRVASRITCPFTRSWSYLSVAFRSRFMTFCCAAASVKSRNQDRATEFHLTCRLHIRTRPAKRCWGDPARATEWMLVSQHVTGGRRTGGARSPRRPAIQPDSRQAHAGSACNTHREMPPPSRAASGHAALPGRGVQAAGAGSKVARGAGQQGKLGALRLGG
jgi:hypothetical protein